MGKSVALDRSGWSAEALARADAETALQARYRAYGEARAQHEFAGVLAGVSDASMAASTAPRWIVKTRDFGNGHREAVICRDMSDPAATLERAIDRDLKGLAPPPTDPEDNRERAVRRAKQKVRLLCKSMIVNSLWTLTYRANVTDRDLCLRHFDAFRRRVVAVLGEWRYVCTLEKQERGAYHFHLATHALPVRLVKGGVKVKSWDVMRAIWRDVVGDLGGNFDEAKRKRRNGNGSKAIKGAGAIASYIAGYVAKDMLESPHGRKRYSHSVGIEVPEAFRVEFSGDVPMRELIDLIYAFVGQRVQTAWFAAEREVFFIATDDTASVG